MSDIIMSEKYCPQTHCFANDAMRQLCVCLDNTDFGDRVCPFFKTHEAYERDLKRAEKHNRQMGVGRNKE